MSLLADGHWLSGYMCALMWCRNLQQIGNKHVRHFQTREHARTCCLVAVRGVCRRSFLCALLIRCILALLLGHLGQQRLKHFLHITIHHDS